MKLACIGAGNMATALLTGCVNGGVLPPEALTVYDIDDQKARALRDKLGILVADSLDALLKDCDMALLAVKPNIAPKLLREKGECLAGKALLSIAAGLPTDKLRALLPEDARILRVMPNTPCLCGEGMAALSRESTFTSKEHGFAEKLFAALGRFVWVEEAQMDAVTGLSGSSPAYAFLFIEALADGGVFCGLGRDLALEMAAQTLKGSAELLLQMKKHPGAMKDMVCSPGGTTIEGVRALENRAFRAAVMDAVIAGTEKSRSLRG